MFLEPRENYKPFEYPQYFEYYQRAIASVWRPEEVDMTADLADWHSCTDEEREVIAGILKGFTQLECHVSDYWSRMADYFPKHEIIAACRAFSLFEQIHISAYSILSDTLGINEYEAFLGDPVARKKLEEFNKQNNPKVAIAVFSGAGEGVSLFSSFAALLSFNLDGRFKGLSQIISWSVLDEQMHHELGCQLFREFVLPSITEEEKELIIKGFDLVIENEVSFIHNVFNGYTLNKINANSLLNYLYFRANKCLNSLGFPATYSYNSNEDTVRKWFEPLVSGNSSNDFFSQSKDGANYQSKLDFDLNINSKNISNLKEWVENV